MTDTFVSIHPAIAALLLVVFIVESSALFLVAWLRKGLGYEQMSMHERVSMVFCLALFLFLIGYLAVALTDATLK